MEYSKQSQNIGKKSLVHFDSALKFCIYKGGIFISWQTLRQKDWVFMFGYSHHNT